MEKAQQLHAGCWRKCSQKYMFPIYRANQRFWLQTEPWESLTLMWYVQWTCAQFIKHKDADSEVYCDQSEQYAELPMWCPGGWVRVWFIPFGTGRQHAQKWAGQAGGADVQGDKSGGILIWIPLCSVRLLAKNDRRERGSNEGTACYSIRLLEL